MLVHVICGTKEETIRLLVSHDDLLRYLNVWRKRIELETQMTIARGAQKHWPRDCSSEIKMEGELALDNAS